MESSGSCDISVEHLTSGMAYRRSLLARATLTARSYSPSFCYVTRDHDHKEESSERAVSQEIHSITKQRYFGSGFHPSFGSSGFVQGKNFSPFFLGSSAGFAFVRYMSTTGDGGSDKIEMMNEVAIATADCYFPTAALQHFLDAVHNFTGLNWWGSIIITTILIRSATVPLLINQLKSTAKLSKVKQEMDAQSMDRDTVAQGKKRRTNLFKECGVTPLIGPLLQGFVFISFFLGIQNMVENVSSLKTGGAYWFTDLTTTPDAFYIFPILTGLTFFLTVQCNMQEGMEGNPAANTMKKVSRIFACLSVPFTMKFPPAVHCYWITSNLFSLTYGLVLKAPGVKKALGVPEIPAPPSSTTPQPSFSLFSALKQALEGKAARLASSSPPNTEPSKGMDQRISSNVVLSQRLRNLEKQVKGRKKNKKRNKKR